MRLRDRPASAGIAPVGVLLTGLALAATHAGAQAGPPPAAPPRSASAAVAGIEGLVTADPGGRPLADAHVLLLLGAVRREAGTDARGAFRIEGVAPGTYTLVVRKVGFGAASAAVTLAAGVVAGADIALTAAVPQLAPVRVAAAAAPEPGSLAAVAAAARRHGAPYIARAALDSAFANGRALPELFQSRSPAAQLVRYTRTGAVLVSSGRGLISLTQTRQADPTDPQSPKACYAQVFVGGAQLYAPDHADMVVPDLNAYQLPQLEGIAFYPGPAATPAQYAGTGAACGTLVIWTRH